MNGGSMNLVQPTVEVPHTRARLNGVAGVQDVGSESHNKSLPLYCVVLISRRTFAFDMSCIERLRLSNQRQSLSSSIQYAPAATVTSKSSLLPRVNAKPSLRNACRKAKRRNEKGTNDSGRKAL